MQRRVENAIGSHRAVALGFGAQPELQPKNPKEKPTTMKNTKTHGHLFSSVTMMPLHGRLLMFVLIFVDSMSGLSLAFRGMGNFKLHRCALHTAVPMAPIACTQTPSPPALHLKSIDTITMKTLDIVQCLHSTKIMMMEWRNTPPKLADMQNAINSLIPIVQCLETGTVITDECYVFEKAAFVDSCQTLSTSPSNEDTLDTMRTTSDMANSLQEVIDQINTWAQHLPDNLTDLGFTISGLFLVARCLDIGASAMTVDNPFWKNVTIARLAFPYVRQDEEIALMAKLYDLFIYHGGEHLVGNWSDFTTLIRSASAQLSDGRLTQEEYDAVLSHRNSALDFDSLELINFNETIAHCYSPECITDELQLSQFLHDCGKVDFSPKFQHISKYFITQMGMDRNFEI